MKTPRQCKCHLCKVDLTAVQKQVDRKMGSRGVRRMWTLVAPPRAEITLTVGKKFVRFFLCPSHWSPSDVAVSMDMFLERGELGTFRRLDDGKVVAD